MQNSADIFILVRNLDECSDLERANYRRCLDLSPYKIFSYAIIAPDSDLVLLYKDLAKYTGPVSFLVSMIETIAPSFPHSARWMGARID